jgi:hypothetical protein
MIYAMIKRFQFLPLLGLACLSECLLAVKDAPAADLHLVPWPKIVSVGSSTLDFTKDTRIVATYPSLLPLAKLLADELFLALGRQYVVAQGEAKDGDIVLKLDPSLKGEAYTLRVEKTADVSGGNYAAVAMGTVTLSQAIEQSPGKVSMPKLKVEDAPDYRMRAIQMCIKHQIHQISKIKQGVDLCRQFKLNTLALHMSNYQLLWMLCPAFREKPLPKGGSDGGQTYSLEEMKDLVEYARQRGVVIMPEWGPADFAMPGEMMQWFYKARQFGDYKGFDPAKQTLLDNPRFWEAIDEMSKQMADVFSTTEYIHVGALDGETGHWETMPGQEFMKAHNLRGSGDVWAWLLKRLYEINKKHGKQTMAFEGVGRDAAAHVRLPKEVAFFAYQTWYYSSNEMIADGYRVLNAAWRPLYTCGGYPAREIYAWSSNIVRHNGDSNINIHLPKSDRFLGSLLSTWEGTEIGHLEILTDRGAAMAERCWNENAGRTWDDFNRRLKPTVARLEAIQFPMGISVDGLVADNAFLPLDGRWSSGTACFAGPLTITMKPRIPGVKVYYTVQDPYFIWGPDRPGPASPRSKLYQGPIKDVAGIFRAQCFDASGQPVGGEYVKIFQYCPIRITVEGAEEKYDSLGRTQGRPFHLKAVVKFSTDSGKKLRYRTTPPNAQPDLEYTGPITINKTTTFWVGIAGTDGYPLQTTIGDDGFRQNLLTAERVKVTTDAKNQIGDPNLVCDGYAGNPDAHWNGIGDCHLTIEMTMPRKMNELEVVTWWGDGRAYRYTVEASADGKMWKQIVDMSRNTKGSSPEGYKHAFDLMSIRCLRFHMMGNTTNNHGHLVEVRVLNTTEAAK